MKTIYDYFRCALLASVAVLAICMCMFASCSGDDNDVPGGGSAQIGVHRIDLHFDNGFQNWYNLIIVHGVKPDGSFNKLYENGKELSFVSEGTQIQGYASEELRDYSISTDDNCGAMVATVSMSSLNGLPATRDVTITAVGYINGKRIYTKVFTLPAGAASMAMVFTTDDGGESELIIDGVIVESDHD